MTTPVDALIFTVRGTPVPQGSARAFVRGARAIVVTQGKGPITGWRDAVATEARFAMGDRPILRGLVRVDVDFRLQRPQAHYRGPAALGVLRPTAPHWHGSRPDVDKLARAVLDALTGVVFADDGQVASLDASKQFSDPGAPGATVTVTVLEEAH